MQSQGSAQPSQSQKQSIWHEPIREKIRRDEEEEERDLDGEGGGKKKVSNINNNDNSDRNDGN
jgi:hypothetical protein